MKYLISQVLKHLYQSISSGPVIVKISGNLTYAGHVFIEQFLNFGLNPEAQREHMKYSRMGLSQISCRPFPSTKIYIPAAKNQL